MSSVLLFTMGTSAFAQTKEEAQQKIQQLKQEQSQLQSRLSELQANKADTEAYIQQLDEEMNKVVEDITDANERLEQIQGELDETQKNLDEAQKKADNQYAALKLRIKQMYEQGDPSLLEIIMRSEDITSVLNSSEYISKVSEYDHQLLESLNATLKQIADYKAQLEQQKSDLEDVKSELEIKQQDLQSIIDQKNAELESLGYDINDIYDSMTQTNSELDDTQKILDAIVEQERKDAEAAAARKKAAEEAAKNASKQNQNTASNSTNNTTTSNKTDTKEPSGQTTTNNSGSTGTNFIWPLSGGYVSSGYGGRTSPTAGASSNHKGVDIAIGAGSNIYSVASGTVVTVSYNVARGNYIVVNHGNGVSTLYQHCSAIYASVGQSVSQGQTIAAVGSTGYSTGPHLHFEVLINGANVNPMNYL